MEDEKTFTRRNTRGMPKILLMEVRCFHSSDEVR